MNANSNAPAVEENKEYDPCRLLDYMMEKFQCKNDAALCRLMDVEPPYLSKIRNRHLPIGASLLIRMHEMTQQPVRYLRDIMGDRRENFRISKVHRGPRNERPSIPPSKTLTDRSVTA